MDLSRRLELQTLLESILGSKNVYFQPSSNVTLKYPAIIYQIDDIRNNHADNRPYIQSDRYQITVIDRDPDSETPRKISRLPKSAFNRFFVSSGLNHTVFTLYF